jgi:hypothetical protein
MANPGTELASLDFGNLIGGPLNAVITAQAKAAESTANFIKTVGFDADNKPIYVDFKYPKEIAPYQAAKNPQITLVKVTTKGVGYAPNQVVNVVFTGPTDAIPATGNLVANAVGDIEIGSIVNITNPGDYPTISNVTATVETSPSIDDDGITAEIITINFSTKIEAKDALYQEMQFSVPQLAMLPIPFIKVDEITIDFNAKINSVETQSQSSELDVKGSVEAGYGGKRGYVKFNGSVAYKKTTSSGSSVERTYSMAIHVKASQDEMPAGMEKLLNILEGAMISTPGKITSGK